MPEKRFLSTKPTLYDIHILCIRRLRLYNGKNVGVIWVLARVIEWNRKIKIEIFMNNLDN